MKARDVIVDALERINRLSPGETPDDDLLAFCLRRLNGVIGEWAAQGRLLFETQLVQAAQSGDIVLGAGPWAAVQPGSRMLSVLVDNVPLTPITVDQYATIRPTTGRPSLFAVDGLSRVLLAPTPSNEQMTVHAARGIAAITDIDASIVAPPGYEPALGAALAVRLAPVLLGQLPQTLLLAERRAMQAIGRVEPAILSADPLARDNTAAMRLFT